MSIYTNGLQQLYVAYFSRPADVNGLAYWEGVMAAGGKLTDVGAAFATSAEYNAAYSTLPSTEAKITKVYQNLFGRGPDAEGLNYWTQGLTTGDFTFANMVTIIADAAVDGAVVKDKTTLANKVSAATAFTLTLDTPEEITAYANGDKNGGTANTKAIAFIASVTTDASLTAATTKAALDATVANVTGDLQAAYAATVAASLTAWSTANGASSTAITAASAANTAYTTAAAAEAVAA